MTKIFLFDIDHVLVHPPSYGATYTLDHAGLDSLWTTDFFAMYYEQCQQGKKDLIDSLTPYLTQCGWQKSTEDFLHAWFTYEHHPDMKLLEYIQTLREKGYSCIINSDQEPNRKQYILEEMNFKHLFDAFYFSCDIEYLKQDVKRFEIVYDDIVKQFGAIKKEEIFYIDDQEKNIAVAKNFGIDAVLYESSEKTMKEIEKRINR
ncbi:MAG: hypothetical protein CO030_00410 [Candidatus Magasanikbacteria bacterium CG_4_9_14_0_2_um_filter_42_11]|uniref:Haloacid dehalogenase n=1 Tax=Candidatus Magasanikbacteria bacterium CG_4_9_14_0_2_um_filter_42_11 TaxID=1974643 RepID=A0A2M8FB19_9BACT|nr:MAG: hypothetical protein CO030_00410 [Candidatus Magasanikbacteria bacterium CG_4_9_14_0_2_um_filter_42_11]